MVKLILSSLYGEFKKEVKTLKKAKYFDTCERCGLEEEVREGQPEFTQVVSLKVGSEKAEKKDLCQECVTIVRRTFNEDSKLEVKKPE